MYINLIINKCGGDREIQVSRELTKKFEEHIGNNINEVQEFFEKEQVLGEITIVIKGVHQIQKQTEFDEFEFKSDDFQKNQSPGLVSEENRPAAPHKT